MRRICARRGIEAASALSLIALTSFSQSWALSVGELKVASALGEPLRASVYIDTAAGESLDPRCLRLSAPADVGMPNVSGVSLSLERSLKGATLRFSGQQPMREPMSEMILTIACPRAPSLTRSFLVFLDPPVTAAAPAFAGATGSANRGPRDVAARSPQRAGSSRRAGSGAAKTPIEPGSVYTVQSGDVLSVVAARVAGRPEYSVWPIAQRIFDTNPQAFDGPDPNTLRVGATIDIPELTGMLAVKRTGVTRRGVVVRAAKTGASAGAGRAAPTVVPRARIVERRTRAPRLPKPRPVIKREEPVAARTGNTDNLALSPGLSRLSMDRLRQRRSGTIVARPTAVVAAPAQVNSAPRDVPTTTVAAPATPIPAAKARVVTKSRHWLIDWLWLAGGLFAGVLATSFGMRGWLRQQKLSQEREIARSRRYQEKLDASRQTRPQEKAPAIVVLEELPRMDFTAPESKPGQRADDTAATIEDAPVDGLAHNDERESADAATTEASLEPAVVVDEIEPQDDSHFDDFDAPNESDLELLARDYAQTTANISETEPALDLDLDLDETRAMFAPDSAPGAQESELDLVASDYAHTTADTSELEPALDLDLDLDETRAVLAPDTPLGPEEMAASSDGTQIMASGLDLELPEASGDETLLDIESLRSLTHDDDRTDAAIELDESLLSLARDEAPDADDADTTAETLSLDPDDSANVLLDDDPTSAIATGDTHDFYHLEASAAGDNSKLSFEEELEQDESKVLSFHKWQDKSGGGTAG